MNRLLRLAFLLIFLLSACSTPPAAPSRTPAPTLAGTPTPPKPRPTFKKTYLTPVRPAGTRTARVSRTPVQTAAPTLTPSPILTPLPGSQYRLAKWDAQDFYSALSGEQGNINLGPVLLKELLLRAPAHPLREEWENQLIRNLMYDPYPLPELPAEPLRARVEKALNSGETQPSGLANWLEKDSNDHPIGVVETLPAPNLYGDGRDATVLHVLANWQAHAYLIVTKRGNGYQVDLLDEYMRVEHWVNESMDVLDLNHNGSPEILIYHNWYGIGFTHGCDNQLMAFEWDGTAFRDLAGHIGHTFINTDYGNCGEWRYPQASDGTRRIVGQELMQSPLIYEGVVPFELAEQLEVSLSHFYRWYGTEYEWERDEISPLPAEATAAEAVPWAVLAGWQNDQALAALENALQNWPADLQKTYGPAGEDFFRFKLGVWYALRGMTQQAADLLAQVRDHPVDREHQTVSQLASVFLNAYNAGQLSAACQAANRLLENQLNVEHNDFFTFAVSPGFSLEKMRSAWGVSDPLWFNWNEFVFPFPFSSDVYRPCPSQAAFQTALQQQPAFPSTPLFTAWLSRQYTGWSSLKEPDLDSDGQSDWLFLARTGRYDQYQLWAVLRKPGGLTPLLVSKSDLGSGNLPTNAFSIPVPGGGTRVFGYRAGNQVIFFRLIEQQGKLIVTHPVDNNARGWINLRSAQVAGADQILIIDQDGGDWIVAWNETKNALALTYSPWLRYQREVRAAEKAIFEYNQPAQAASMLEDLLAGEIPEDQWSEGSDPSRRIHALYLLALAYELAGNQQPAVRAYVQLWRDYPATFHAAAARLKLEPVP